MCVCVFVLDPEILGFSFLAFATLNKNPIFPLPLPRRRIQTTNRGVPTAPLKITSGGDTGVETTVSLEGEQEGYLARLKKAMSESIDTAKTAPETFEEALAVLRGEREVKPDYERAAYTVSAVRQVHNSTF